MSGETDLQNLLMNLEPDLSRDQFVFCQVESGSAEELLLESQGAVREEAGWTLILPVDIARKHKLGYDLVFRKITLQVYSSLKAVGLLAEISRSLVRENIAVNVISGHDHDHLYVLEQDAEKALEVLQKLSARA